MKTIGSLKILTSVDPTYRYGKVAVIKTHAKSNLVDGGVYSRRVFINFRIIINSSTNVEFADVVIRAKTGLTKEDNTMVVKTNGGTQIDVVATYEYEKISIYLKTVANCEIKLDIDESKSKYVKGYLDVSDFIAYPSTSVIIPTTKI